MFKVNRNTRTRRCEVCSKLTIKTLEQRHWHRSGVFMVNFLLLTLNRQMPTGEFNNQKDGWYLPSGIYVFKVNTGNTRAICSEQ